MQSRSAVFLIFQDVVQFYFFSKFMLPDFLISCLCFNIIDHTPIWCFSFGLFLCASFFDLCGPFLSFVCRRTMLHLWSLMLSMKVSHRCMVLWTNRLRMTHWTIPCSIHQVAFIIPLWIIRGNSHSLFCYMWRLNTISLFASAYGG